MNDSVGVESDLVSRDVEPIVEAVSRLFGHHVVRSCGPAQGVRRLSARSVGGTLIGKLEYASDFSCVVDQPRRHLVLTVPHRCSGHMGGDFYSHDDVLAFNVDWVGCLDLSPPGIFLNTAITDEQVTFGFKALYGYEPDTPVRFAEKLTGGTRAADRAQQVIRVLHDSYTESAVLQKVRENWAVMELLSIWPHSNSNRVHADAMLPSTVKRAVEYIDANLDRPISVVDVAVAMQVGLRALTNAFTKHLGETPGRYLRARRLDAANAMMQTNSELSVIDVATHWQFSNPGMFARYFRMRFGCLPGSIRRRSTRS